MTEDNKVKNEKALENVDGGSTWDPVDEECEFYNNPYGCQNPNDKGTFRKCARCKNR